MHCHYGRFSRLLTHIPLKLPWIFPGAPLIFNGALGNIQSNLERYADIHLTLSAHVLSPDGLQNTSAMEAVTCMSWGSRLYRTFDGMQFVFLGRCMYYIYHHGTRNIAVDMEECPECDNCKKVSGMLSGETTAIAGAAILAPSQYRWVSARKT